MNTIWKLLAVVLMLYVLVFAWTGEVSAQVVLHETIRNLYFHVSMWFGMIFLLIAAVFYGIRYLNTENPIHDLKAEVYTRLALLFGFIGIVTGMVWAYYTWGTPWIRDPQLNGAAVTILAYMAYFVLRNAVNDPQKRADISAVYGIFAFLLMIVLVLIIPRVQDVHSLHPGKGGNPGLSSYKDLSGNMRQVFYPAVIAFTLIGFWIAALEIKWKKNNHE
jgi:heme exporter protein C